MMLRIAALSCALVIMWTSAFAIPPLPDPKGGVFRIEERCSPEQIVTISIAWEAGEVARTPRVSGVNILLNAQSVLSERQLEDVVRTLNRWTEVGYLIRRAEIGCPVRENDILVKFIVEQFYITSSFREVILLNTRGPDGRPRMGARRQIEGRWEIVPAETADVSAPPR